PTVLVCNNTIARISTHRLCPSDRCTTSKPFLFPPAADNCPVHRDVRWEVVRCDPIRVLELVGGTAMKRWLFFAYGVADRLLFLAVFAYLAGFVGNFLVPKQIDTPTSDATSTAIAINLLLLGIFAAQHSIMARPAFKAVWTRIIPQPIERATYVL